MYMRADVYRKALFSIHVQSRCRAGGCYTRREYLSFAVIRSTLIESAGPW